MTDPRTCIRCVLPDTFPGVTFDQNGLCNHCSRGGAAAEEKHAQDQKACEQRFRDLLAGSRESAYDVLVAFSGGKDSTYTLSILKHKYGARVLALSVDNGFVSEMARRNIRTVTDRLGIDHQFFKPKWHLLKSVFTAAVERELYSKKTLERASTICTSCMGIVKALCLKTAIEQGIPMIGYGWSPGQAPIQSAIMKNNPSFVRMAQDAVLGPLREVAGDEIASYFLEEHHYAQADRFPFNVHPLAWETYNEHMILGEIAQYGWTAPRDTDSNSTNCLLNAFANDVHIKRYGFHPYVWEIANMVRLGVMTRSEGYEKIYGERSSDLVKSAAERLGIP